MCKSKEVYIKKSETTVIKAIEKKACQFQFVNVAHVWWGYMFLWCLK